MNLIKYIPNTFTTLNLLSGCMGLISLYEGNLAQGAVFILIGAVFDFLDGFSARVLNAMSRIGKELDSLADLITFGVLPSFILYLMIQEQGIPYISLLSLLVVIGSAFRLARFNIDESQKEVFTGMPTPANAFLIAGLVFCWDAEWEIFSIIYGNLWGLVFFTLICSLLLNVPLKFMSFKIKEYAIRGNELSILLALVSVVLLILFNLKGIFPATVFYLLLSLVQNIFVRKAMS
jgi:CDP-diacylglycerol--serine O-phosphatidyltransferase